MTEATHKVVFEIPKKIRVQCPECYKLKDIKLPKNMPETENPLIGFYLSSGVVCDHHFYFVADKQMKVRGFFNVDYEIPSAEIS